MFFRDVKFNLSMGKFLTICELLLDGKGYYELYEKLTDNYFRESFFNNNDYFGKLNEFLKDNNYPISDIDNFISEVKHYIATKNNDSILRDYVNVTSLRNVIRKKIDTKSKILNFDAIVLDFQEALITKATPANISGFSYERGSIAGFIVYYFNTMYKLDKSSSKLIYKTVNESGTSVDTSKGDRISLEEFESIEFVKSGSSFQPARDIKRIVDCSTLLFRAEASKSSKILYSDLVTEYIKYRALKKIKPLEDKIVFSFYPIKYNRKKELKICKAEEGYFVLINTDIIDTGNLNDNLKATYDSKVSVICDLLFEDLFQNKNIGDIRILREGIENADNLKDSSHSRLLLGKGSEIDSNFIIIQKGAKALAELISYCKLKKIDYREIPYKLFRNSNEFKNCVSLEDYLDKEKAILRVSNGLSDSKQFSWLPENTELLEETMDDYNKKYALESIKLCDLSTVSETAKKNRETVNKVDIYDIQQRLTLNLAKSYGYYKQVFYFAMALSLNDKLKDEGDNSKTKARIEQALKQFTPKQKFLELPLSDNLIVEQLDNLFLNHNLFDSIVKVSDVPMSINGAKPKTGIDILNSISMDSDGEFLIPSLRLKNLLRYLNLEILILIRMLTYCCTEINRVSDLDKLGYIGKGFIKKLPNDVDSLDTLREIDLHGFDVSLLLGCGLDDLFSKNKKRFNISLTDLNGFTISSFIMNGDDMESDMSTYYTIYANLKETYKDLISFHNSRISQLHEYYLSIGIDANYERMISKELKELNIKLSNREVSKDSISLSDSFVRLANLCTIVDGYLFYKNKPCFCKSSEYYVHSKGYFVSSDGTLCLPMPKNSVLDVGGNEWKL